MVDTFAILSPVSELGWDSHSLEVLSSPKLMSLSVGFTEKNKRVISNFSVQHLQLKQQRKKNNSFFPNLHISQLRSSQPSELALLILTEVTGNAILLERFTGSSWSEDCQCRIALCGQSEVFHSSLNAHRSAAVPWAKRDKVSVQYMACLLHPMKGSHKNGYPAQSLSWSSTTLACPAASSTG